jgi:Coenzyme PQQ synthesis protein D (PqqD)
MNSALRFESDTPVRWHSSHIAAEVDGLVVALSMSQGKYVGFDAMATQVWQRLACAPTMSQLCEGLAREFDGDRMVIQRDVVELLTQLHEWRLIEIEAGGIWV